jgi:hypothetical protein
LRKLPGQIGIEKNRFIEMGQLVVEDGSILRIDLITLYGQVDCFTFQVVGGITYLRPDCSAKGVPGYSKALSRPERTIACRSCTLNPVSSSSKLNLLISAIRCLIRAMRYRQRD